MPVHIHSDYQRATEKGQPNGVASLGADGKVPADQLPTSGAGAHATSHQNNGADEISVQGLSGLLADAQTPTTHAHSPGDVTGTAVVTSDARLSDARTPTTHAHPQSDVTGLDTALSGKSDTGHTHSTYQATSEKAQANGYASLGTDGKVPSAQLPAGSGGGATYGKTTVDFGAFPGKSDTSVAVTGQSSITASSNVNAWLRPEATADHTADEHILETINVFAGNIVPSTGFTIYAVNSSQQHEPLEIGRSGRAAIATVGAQSGDASPRIGGRGTRIYGLWTVSWVWS